MTTLIQNAGQAMRTVQAVLRQHGYTADRIESQPVVTPTPIPAYRVTGQLQTFTTGDGVGAFAATVREDGTFTITAGAFGRITQNGVDEFTDL